MADQRGYGRLTTVMLKLTAPPVYNYFPRSVCWLGYVLIIFAVVMTALRVIVGKMALNTLDYSINALPVLTILTGAFGIAAASQKTSCKIITTLVLSVFNVTFNFYYTRFFIAIIVSKEEEEEVNQLKMVHRQSYEYQYTTPTSSETTRSLNWIYAWCIVLLILSIIEAVTAVAMAVISCKFACFCCKKCCCEYDTTITETGILFEGRSHESLQAAFYNDTPTTYDVNTQLYPPIKTVGIIAGNNAWLQQNKYTRLDDGVLFA